MPIKPSLWKATMVAMMYLRGVLSRNFGVIFAHISIILPSGAMLVREVRACVSVIPTIELQAGEIEFVNFDTSSDVPSCLCL
jgi:hypothetical protein